MLKSYTDGMTDGHSGDTGGSKAKQGPSSLARNSIWVLSNSTGESSLSGNTATGQFVPVDLSQTSPTNETAKNADEGDPNE
jgi:hypothetical protein